MLYTCTLCDLIYFFIFLTQAKPHLVLGIQILNPIRNESTEKILIYDGQSISNQARMWDLSRDLLNFPSLSKTHGIILKYESGLNALGNVIIVITSTIGKKTFFAKK